MLVHRGPREVTVRKLSGRPDDAPAVTACPIAASETLTLITVMYTQSECTPGSLTSEILIQLLLVSVFLPEAGILPRSSINDQSRVFAPLASFAGLREFVCEAGRARDKNRTVGFRGRATGRENNRVCSPEQRHRPLLSSPRVLRSDFSLLRPQFSANARPRRVLYGSLVRARSQSATDRAAQVGCGQKDGN